MSKCMLQVISRLAAVMFAVITCPAVAEEHQFSKEEIALIKEAASKGGIKAQALLGTLYYRGNGVEMDDAQAVKWWRKSAEQGNPHAQYDLAMAYHEGTGGLQKSDKKSVEWFRKGAEKGEARSQYNLGIAYYNGLGIKKDRAQAMQWFQKAAEQDNADAQYILAAGYKDGIGGMQKDPILSYVWISRAKNNGHRDAAKDIEGVESALTASQLEQAKRMLDEIKTKPSQ